MWAHRYFIVERDGSIRPDGKIESVEREIVDEWIAAWSPKDGAWRVVVNTDTTFMMVLDVSVIRLLIAVKVS